jgi:small conductance mechanosensitive channel
MAKRMKKSMGFATVLGVVLLAGPAMAQTTGGDPNAATGQPLDLSHLNMDTARTLATRMYDLLMQYGLRVIGAIIIFLVGRWLAHLLSRLVRKALTKARIDPTLVPFIENLTFAILMAFVIIAALANIGVQTTSAIAVLGAAGLAVGLALQGSLANFAAGVLLLLFKPFKVGDFVEVAGVKGTVRAVHIFNTMLDSPDNVRIIVPNAQVTGGNVSNYTANGTRRVDLVVGISYGDDIRKAKRVIETVLAADKRVLSEPEPTVAVMALGDSSVNFAVRPWVKATDYWGAYFDLTGNIKMGLDENGITIPFPQRDVHVYGGSLAAAAK